MGVASHKVNPDLLIIDDELDLNYSSYDSLKFSEVSEYPSTSKHDLSCVSDGLFTK